MCSVVFTDIFKWSRSVCKVQACFKSAIIVPVHKNTNVYCLKDYRPVVLTSVIMKVFEKLVTNYLSSVMLDNFQFAYRENWFVEDSVSLYTHSLLQHLEANVTHACVLFIDFSSAFNNIVPARMQDNLLKMGVNRSLYNWIFDFLTNRSQGLKSTKLLPNSIGAPQGLRSVASLYSLYSNNTEQTSLH